MRRRRMRCNRGSGAVAFESRAEPGRRTGQTTLGPVARGAQGEERKQTEAVRRLKSGLRMRARRLLTWIARRRPRAAEAAGSEPARGRIRAAATTTAHSAPGDISHGGVARPAARRPRHLPAATWPPPYRARFGRSDGGLRTRLEARRGPSKWPVAHLAGNSPPRAGPAGGGAPETNH